MIFYDASEVMTSLEKLNGHTKVSLLKLFTNHISKTSSMTLA